MRFKFFATRATALLSLALVVGLAGCGQKGELYRDAPTQDTIAKTSQPMPAPIPTTPGQAR